MKLPIFCSECMRSLPEGKTVAGPVPPVKIASFRNDGRYDVTCPQGHRTVVVLQNQGFELLFEIGACAIKDGYYREAVSSFAASLERFYEFFIRAALLNEAEDENARAKVIDKAWKPMSNRSEQQLGAFIILYLRECGEPPPLLDSERVSFRNAVVHKGRIPSRQEAVDYGQAVLDVIRPLLVTTQKKFSKGVQRRIFQHLGECARSGGGDGRAGTIGIRTIVSLSMPDARNNSCSLEEAMARMANWEDILRKTAASEKSQLGGDCQPGPIPGQPESPPAEDT